MDHKIYQKYMLELLQEAITNSDGKPTGIGNYLAEIPLPGRFARNREEKLRALAELKQAFNEHRHWPLDIILSQLGVDAQSLKGKQP